MEIKFTSDKQRYEYYEYELAKINKLIEELMENEIDQFIRDDALINTLAKLHSELKRYYKWEWPE